MADFELLPNPDNIPGLAETGYKRQNTNFFASVVGLDTTKIFFTTRITINGPVGTAQIVPGGIIELNGSLFKITKEVKVSTSAVRSPMMIAFDPSRGFFEAPNSGVFDYTKNGRYLPDGSRVLDKIVVNELVFDLDDEVVVGGGEQLLHSVSGDAKELELEAGWYKIDMQGGTGGNAAAATVITPPVKGGVGGRAVEYFCVTRKTRVLAVAGKKGLDGSKDESTGKRSGGSGGAATFFEIPNLGILFVCGGGGGAAGTVNQSFSGTGGDGGDLFLNTSGGSAPAISGILTGGIGFNRGGDGGVVTDQPGGQGSSSSLFQVSPEKSGDGYIRIYSL